MDLGRWVLGQRRLFLIMAVLFTTLGILSLRAVPKDEDPRLPDWFASLIVVLPGGDVRQIDEMIAKPINDKLKEIDELKKVETTTRMSVASFILEMKDSERDTKAVWDKVRRALEEIQNDFPAGTRAPEFFENANRLETILYAVTGNGDLLSLKASAEDLKQKLLAVPGTSMVLIHGDPQEEIQVEFSHRKLEELSVPHGQLTQKIARANTGMPAGSLNLGGRRVPVIIPSRLESAEQVGRLRVLKGSGDTVAIDEVATVRESARRFESAAYWNDRRALFVGVVAQSPIEILRFGRDIRAAAAEFVRRGSHPEIELHEVSFNPDRTEERLRDLGTNLIIGILTVGLILWVWMGWKVGFIVSVFVPVISFVGFFVFSATGGVLHQISLAAFVISLGQFIDNIIVIVEWMDTKIAEGLAPMNVARDAIDQFKKPMFFATGTNISAFLPMLASTGTTAEFTFSIPLVSIITMIAAWIMALFVVPVFAGYLFQFFPTKKNEGGDRGGELLSAFAGGVAARPLAWSALSAVILIVSSVGFVFVKKQFFPLADRDQLTVKIELPEGTSPRETDAQTKKLVAFLRAQPQVESVASYVGEQVPRFYYNVGLGQWGPHIAELIVLTRDKSDNKQVIANTHAFAEKEFPGAFVLARNLEQGPPLPAPIEYKIFDEEEDRLAVATMALKNSLGKSHRDLVIKETIGAPVQRIALSFDQDLTERFGISEDQLALALLSSTSGVAISKYFENGKTKDIRLTGPEIRDLSEFRELPVRSSAFRNLKLKDIATVKLEESPAVIHRLNGARMSQVLGWPQGDRTADQIVEAFQGEVETIAKNNDVRIEIGGEREGAGDANMAILLSIPLGIMVLVICLLLEFNSIRKMAIILLSVPFVIAGVTPGLLLGDAAFGFMSLLGVLALVGIVVNNSILLIESIDESRELGSSVRESVVKALESRTRPILLTAVTTIAGLLPMAFEESTLWPPLALAMISGLIGSTIITLIFVPSLYFICFDRQAIFQRPMRRPATTLSILTLILAGIGDPAEAKVYGLREALRSVDGASPEVQAARAEEERLKSLVSVQRRAGFMPKIGFQVEVKHIHETLTQTNPFGTFRYGKSDQTIGGIELTQPLLDLKAMSGDVGKLESLTTAASFQKRSILQTSKRQVVHHLVEFRKMKLSSESLKRLEKSLIGIEKEIQKFVKIGLRGQSDMLSLQLALSENRASQVKVEAARESLRQAVRIYLPEFDDLEGDLESPAEQKSTAEDISTRPEVRSLEALEEAQRLELKSIRQGHLPTIELKGRYSYADQGLLDQKDWLETAVVLRWALFEGGTRAGAAAAQAREIEKASRDTVALRAKLEAERASVRAESSETLFLLKAAGDDIRRAELARDEDRRNSLAGRTPLKDWLASEIRLEQMRLRLETLRLDKVRIEYDDLFVRGVEVS